MEVLSVSVGSRDIDVVELHKKFTLLNDYIAIKFGLDFEDFYRRRTKGEKPTRDQEENNRNLHEHSDDDLGNSQSYSPYDKKGSYGTNSTKRSNTGNAISKRSSKCKRRKRSSYKINSAAGNSKELEVEEAEPFNNCIENTEIEQMNLDLIKIDNYDSSDQEETFELPTLSLHCQDDNVQFCESQTQSTDHADSTRNNSSVEGEGNMDNDGSSNKVHVVKIENLSAGNVTKNHSNRSRHHRKTGKSVTSAKPTEKKIPLILQGMFFKPVADVGDKVVTAECQKCSPPKLINGSYICTTNFLTHLKRRHPSALMEYHEMLEEQREARSTAKLVSNSKGFQETVP